MLVRMRTKIGGFRNLEEWPDKGGTIDVPDHEAADLIANGYAEEATGEEPAAQSDQAAPAAGSDAAPQSDEAAAADSKPSKSK